MSLADTLGKRCFIVRIEINASGGGSFDALQNSLSGLHTDIYSTIESLQGVSNKLNNITGGVSNLSDAVDSLRSRIRSEELKSDAVKQLSQMTTTFISNTITIDSQVAALVAVNQENFFNTYTWLRPPIEQGKSWWDKFVDGWNDFWGDVGDTIKEVIDGIIDWVKEHPIATKIIVGTAFIIAGAAIIACTGGTGTPFVMAFGEALLGGLKAAAVSAVISGAMNSVIAVFKGENALSAFGNGLADGYMWGGIFFFGGSLISKFGSLKNATQNTKKTQGIINKKNGTVFEEQRFAKFKAKNKVREITVRPNGAEHSIRVDAMGVGKNGKIIVQEYKSGMTGGFRKTQEEGYKLLYENGGVIRGAGKGSVFSGGTIIPPGTKVEIIRPLYKNQFIVKEVLTNIGPQTSLGGGLAGLANN